MRLWALSAADGGAGTGAGGGAPAERLEWEHETRTDGRRKASKRVQICSLGFYKINTYGAAVGGPGITPVKPSEKLEKVHMRFGHRRFMEAKNPRDLVFLPPPFVSTRRKKREHNDTGMILPAFFKRHDIGPHAHGMPEQRDAF